MPIRLCSDCTCPRPATYRGRCQRHAAQRERQINRAGYHIYRSARWRNTRRKFLFENPMCECGRLATDVHHIVDLDDGGDPWAFSNLSGLCRSCHSRITRKRQAGRAA